MASSETADASLVPGYSCSINLPYNAAMIRRANVADVSALGRIINDCAEYGLMLHRPMGFLYEHMRDFHVAEDDGRVIGVCGLNIVWSNLAEVYALAVCSTHRGRGLGGLLVEACVDDAKQLGIARLMTLTYEQKFFDRLGFEICDRQQLPLKVWSECVRCSKNQACDEIAMVRVIEGVAEPEAPPASSQDSYVVPTVLKVGQSARRQKMDEPQ